MPELTILIRKAQYNALKLSFFAVLLLLCLFTLILALSARTDEPNALPLVPDPIMPSPQLLVTQEHISRLSYTDSILGPLSWNLSEDSLLELNRVLKEYDIRSPEEISQFLAQATVETGAGLRLTEAGDEAYFQSRGYTTGTRGAGYLHITHDYGQMAFATWMMKKYIPELSGIEYCNPSRTGREKITAAYFAALQSAANQGLDVSRYSRIVYDRSSPFSTGADYIAQTFAWESAAYYWHIAGIGEALSPIPGVENSDIASERIGGANWASRREAYTAFYPVFTTLT